MQNQKFLALLVGNRVCQHFPDRVPANKIDGKRTVKKICCMNSACAVYISFLNENVSKRGKMNWNRTLRTLFKNLFQDGSYLRLYKELASHSVAPATQLLECLLEGRGVSRQADDLRYLCAQNPGYTIIFFPSITSTIYHWQKQHLYL